MDLPDLNDYTRQLMLEEIEYDIANGNLYRSPRLNSHGRAVWFDRLREAAELHDDGWLAAELRRRLLNEMEPRTRNGRTSMVHVPVTAGETLAEGEFNRYYVRALCRRILGGEAGQLIVIRAKHVRTPRSESQRLLGAVMDAGKLLADLRSNVGIDTALGVPAGPNSGLSVRIDSL